MSTLLISGSGGFLGQPLTRDLLYRGFDCLLADLQPCEIPHPYFKDQNWPIEPDLVPYLVNRAAYAITPHLLRQSLIPDDLPIEDSWRPD